MLKKIKAKSKEFFTKINNRKSTSVHEVDLLEVIKNHRSNISIYTINILEKVLTIHELRVKDVMVARSQMVTIEHDAPWEDVLRITIQSGHSRLPVIDQKQDTIVGILLAKDLLSCIAKNEINVFKMDHYLRPQVVVPENKHLDSLLQEFRLKHNHMAIVVDEYGLVVGLITIEDVLEEIVGNIEDEYDIEEIKSIKQIRNNTFYVNALTSIEEFNAYFNSNLSSKQVATIGGLVMQEVGRFPHKNEQINIKQFVCKVLRSDDKHIYSLEIKINNS